MKKPLSVTNIIRRNPHKAFEEMKYVNPYTGTHKAGNHGFPRFRNTYLRNYTDCPGGLYKYWLGHAGRDMSDLYDKIKEDVTFRRKFCIPKTGHRSICGPERMSRDRPDLGDRPETGRSGRGEWI